MPPGNLEEGRTQMQVIATLARTRLVRDSRPPDDGAGDGRPNVFRWGHLRVCERIGEGTFGEVFRAFDSYLDRDVALKLLRASAGSRRQRAQQLCEARRLAQVHHRHVVQIYGAAVHHKRLGFWMELVRGETLSDLIAGRGALGAQEAALIGHTLCSAIGAIHKSGIAHRDIKAQNVIREDGGRVVVMDLGASERTGDSGRPDRVTGTPLYAAPELLFGEAPAAADDLYSLGVLLYYLVTGDFPLRANSLHELREAHLQYRSRRLHDVRPDLPDAFVRVIEQAIHPDADARFRSAAEMREALTLTFDGIPSSCDENSLADPGGMRMRSARPRWPTPRRAPLEDPAERTVAAATSRHQGEALLRLLPPDF
jgi:serine/threonine protein kinase